MRKIIFIIIASWFAYSPCESESVRVNSTSKYDFSMYKEYWLVQILKLHRAFFNHEISEEEFDVMYLYALEKLKEL